MYKIIIKWDTGEIEEHYYFLESRAIQVIQGYEKAFGNQIVYSACIELKTWTDEIEFLAIYG